MNAPDDPNEPPVLEVVRPFHAFFPQPAVRQRLHYLFAHQHLKNEVFHSPRRFFGHLLHELPQLGPPDYSRWIQAHWAALMQIVTKQNGNDFGFRHRPGTFPRVADLGMEIRNWDSFPLALIRMPRPETTASAHYVGIILLVPVEALRYWPGNAQARYFTLEQVDPSLANAHTHGVFCEWTAGGAHRNVSRSVVVDGEAAFCQQIQQEVMATEQRLAAGFKAP